MAPDTTIPPLLHVSLRELLALACLAGGAGPLDQSISKRQQTGKEFHAEEEVFSRWTQMGKVKWVKSGQADPASPFVLERGRKPVAWVENAVVLVVQVACAAHGSATM